MNLSTYQAGSLLFQVDGAVATLTLNRPERKNPVTHESSAEMAAIFRAAASDNAVRAFVVTGAGGNFCSGGDVHEIIGPLLERALVAEAGGMARELAEGPSFANAMTKRMLQMEWAMSVEEAIEAEAVAQALCMKTGDFRRAYEAFVARRKPVFAGN